MIVLRPWSEDDLAVLQATVGDSRMMAHLGGAETPERIAQRHASYLVRSEPKTGGMFTMACPPDSKAIGTVGFWETAWRGGIVYETGWMVLPAYAGRGIATAAALSVVRLARTLRGRRFLHAFPSIANVASNLVCRKAGFTNGGECAYEYPKGASMRCNDWWIDLAEQES